PGAREPWLTVRLKKPSAAPLRVAFQVSQSRADARVPVGPFLVLGAFRQQGSVAVTAPPEYRLTFHPGPDVSRREAAEDFGREDPVALFNYGMFLTPAAPAAPVPPLLVVEIQAVKGVIESKVEHNLQLTDGGWRVSSRVDVTPVRTGVDT